MIRGLACLFALAGAVPSTGQPADPPAAALLARAGVRGVVERSCRGDFWPGRLTGYAAAVRDDSGRGRYVAVLAEGRFIELEAYAGTADLSCYTVREADRLNATIAASDTINGRVTAEWDGTVVCGFIEPTIAVCWQYAPEKSAFVRIGGWTT